VGEELGESPSTHSSKTGIQGLSTINRLLGESETTPGLYQVTVTASKELLKTVKKGICAEWRSGQHANDAQVKQICQGVPLVKKQISRGVPLEKKSIARSISSKKKGNSCKTTSNLKAQALCPFSPELWNLGSTCITNHVHGEKHPICPEGADPLAIASIKTKCRKAKASDDQKCSRLGMAY